jgi:branched-subunit amino acid aminotransferase/4-amino-4-deoxychorismate lyase
MTKVIFNGKLVDQSEAAIPISNKANFFGYGVYESIRVFRGKPFYPEWHLDRLFASARAIGMEVPYTKAGIGAMVGQVIAENSISDALLRVVYYGKTEKEEGMLFVFPLGFHFYPGRDYRKGMCATTYVWDRILPEAKTLSLLGGFLGLGEAAKRGCVEAILINYKGEVTEGTRSNLFIVDADGKTATPPREQVLEGITRKILLEKFGKEIEERSITPAELFSAREVFLSSTVFGIMPVVRIDGRQIGDGAVGPATKRYAKAHDDFLKERCGK